MKRILPVTLVVMLIALTGCTSALSHGGESSDDTYFVDESSKLYFGRVDKENYSTDINAFYPGGTNQPTLDCIFAQLTE